MKKSVFVLTTLYMLAGCGKNRTEVPVRNWRVSDALKGYFNWKVGSYWVFKDSLNNNLDSFRLIDIEDDVSSPGADNNSSEEVVLEMFEYYQPASDSNRYWQLNLISNSARQNVTDLRTPYFFNGTLVYNYSNFTTGIPFSFSSADPIVQKSLLQSVLVNGKTYTNVYRYYVQYDNTHTDEILMNADSGFIKLSFGKYAHQELLLEKANIVH